MSRRKKILIIGGITMGAIIAAAFALCVGVNSYYGGLIDKALAAQKAAGYPVTLADLSPARIPEAENGAADFRRAAELLQQQTEAEGEIIWPLMDKHPAQWTDDETNTLR